MKKLIAAAAVAVALMAVPAVNAAHTTGGCMGGLYGCCFGLRGALAYNDGKDVIAMEWIDALLLGHIWSAIQGYQGTTTADMRAQYPAFF